MLRGCTTDDTCDAADDDKINDSGTMKLREDQDESRGGDWTVTALIQWTGQRAELVMTINISLRLTGIVLMTKLLLGLVEVTLRSLLKTWPDHP